MLFEKKEKCSPLSCAVANGGRVRRVVAVVTPTFPIPCTHFNPLWALVAAEGAAASLSASVAFTVASLLGLGLVGGSC